MRIHQVQCPTCNLKLDGEFSVSALGGLAAENQVFGTSYPTVKNRLNAIVTQLDRSFEARSPNVDVLEQLSRGEISIDDALRRIV